MSKKKKNAAKPRDKENKAPEAENEVTAAALTETEAELPETETVPEEKPEKGTVSPVRLAVVLTSICIVVALLLGVVNNFTYAQIEANTEKSMLESIKTIFDPSVGVQRVEDVTPYEGITTLYLVTQGDAVCGLAAASEPSGFGGPIGMMTGLDSDGKVVGVQIISMSETPGLGSRTNDDSFLSRFIGKSGSVKIKEDIDAISGATISSTAVTKGVDTVLAALSDVKAVAEACGMVTVPYVPGSTDAPVTEVQTTAPVTEVVTAGPATDAPVETTVPVDGSVVKTDVPAENVVAPPENEAPPYDVAVSDTDTAEYTTLTTEPESTEATSAPETAA